MITAKMRKKAASPAARRKAVATMKRTLAAKRAAEVLWPANRVSRVPIEAIPPRKATSTKPTATGPSYRLIAKLIVHVARALGGGE